MNFLKRNKIVILLLFCFFHSFSFSNNFIMEINIIDLDGIYSNKILNNLKIPFKKIIFSSEGKIISEQYIEKHKIYQKEQKEIGNYNTKELELILNNVFFNKNLEDNFSIYCEDCRILGTEISGLENHYNNISKYLFENEEGKRLYINGEKTYIIGKIFEIKYNNLLIYLYESNSYYKNKEIKTLLNFINTSLKNVPEIEKIKKIRNNKIKNCF